MNRFKTKHISTELFSGLVIAVSLIPEAIGFAFVLGVSPQIAIYTSIILGLVTSLVGGRPAMITAATGAIAAVYIDLVSNYPIEYLFMAVMLSGIIQIVLAYLNFGQLMRLVSRPIMLGFLNGLAVIILLAQVDQFKVPMTDTWLFQEDMTTFIIMVALVIITMIITLLLPKYVKVIPSTLVAIVVVTLLSLVLKSSGFTVYTVFDYAGESIGGLIELPNFSDFPLELQTLTIIAIPAFSAAVVGIIESLLTLNIIDEITDTRGSTKKEIRAQGLGNIISGFFGGMGGCAMLGQSLININNGARTYLSTLFSAITLLVLILFAPQVLEMIPLGVLVGIMFVVVIKTFAWESLQIRKVASAFDFFVVVVVTVVVIATHNLAIGVIAGVILATIKFAWVKSSELSVSVEGDTLHISGMLFFASCEQFKELTDSLEYTHLDFKDAKIVDYTAANTIMNYFNKQRDLGVHVKLENLDEDSDRILRRLNKEIHYKEHSH